MCPVQASCNQVQGLGGDQTPDVVKADIGFSIPSCHRWALVDHQQSKVVINLFGLITNKRFNDQNGRLTSSPQISPAGDPSSHVQSHGSFSRPIALSIGPSLSLSVEQSIHLTCGYRCARFLTSSSFSKPYVGEYLLRLRCIRHAQDLHDGPIQQPARGTEAADRLLKAFPADNSNPAYNFTRAPSPGLCYSLWSSPNTLSAF
jgi:hypothetical protein